ncbi:MAG: hypothetical protein KGH71_01600 [Candidatus Micrarchaeota archaeon]|nr:hypothetical protein [Candidatus Micrarchaeota archaeon]
MANNIKDQPANLSGLNSVARNLLRMSNKPTDLSEMTYHALATLHVFGSVSSLGKVANSEWFKFFYENGYNTNLFVKFAGNQIGIASFTALCYANCSDQSIKDELAEIVRYCHLVKVGSFEKQAVLEVLDFEPINGDINMYNYSSWFGEARMRKTMDGEYFIDFLRTN